MKKLSLILVSIFLLGISSTSFSQNWVDMMMDPHVNFYDVQKAFNKWYKLNEKQIERETEKREKAEKEYKKSNAYKSGKKLLIKGPNVGEGGAEAEGAYMLYKRWEAYVAPRVYPTGDRMQMYEAMDQFAQDMSNSSSSSNNKNSNNVNSFQGPSGPNVQAGNWTLLGPSNVPTAGGAGRINSIRIDPTNTNILYVCAPGGGLWRSSNGGTSWTMWNTDLLASIGATDIAISPANTQNMWLASGDGEAGDTYSLGVLRSTNGGGTWVASGLTWAVSQGRTISKLLIDPGNPLILHAATSAGIYRTTDGGTNWTMVQAGSFKDMEFMPGTAATVYATSYNGGGFWRSTNSGASYTQITTGLPTSGTIRFSIAVTPNNNNRIWLVAANNSNYGFSGFYTSTNGGTSFSTVTVSSPSNMLGWATAGNDVGGQGWYDLAIACSPTNQNEVIVGGVNVWRTTNGGTSWSLNAHWTGSGAPYIHADQHDLFWLPGSGTTYYSGNDGGLFRTTNNGASWTDLSNGLQIAQMYCLGTSATNANLNLSGHQDNGTNRYNAGAWQQVIGGDGMECIIDWSNANTMYGELYYGDIRKSTNGGASFPTQIVASNGTGVNAQGNWVTPYVMHPTANQTLLVGKAGIYRSTNGGTSWAALGATTGGSGNIVRIAYAPSNPNYIYAIKQNAIFMSSNGGTSFTNVTGTVPTSNAFTYITVSTTDPLKAYVTISGYTSANKVFQTTNAGTSWTNYTTGLPNLPVNCIVYQNATPDGVYCGTDVGVYYRDNTTGSWASFVTGLPNVEVYELEIQYSAARIRAATYGRGMWESTLYSSGSSAPLANYTSNTQSGCPGTQIQFTDMSNYNPTSWSWNFPGGTPAISTAQNPLITYNTVGTYQVSLWATNINGTDSVLRTWVTISNTIPLPLQEGFQLTQFLPVNWTARDANSDGVFWQRSTTVGGYGLSSACSYFDNATIDVAGARDEMWSPKYNLTTLSTCSLTFDVAYARYNAAYFDSLEVLVSTNCGQTWTQVYINGNSTLATAPDNSTSIFVPTNTQWRTETVNLNAYVTATNLMVSFKNRGYYGQMLYIDNINLTGAPASGPPAAAFTASQTNFCRNTCINFTDNSTNTPTSWAWTFPGGTPGTSTAQNPTNICFNTAGTYTVQLVATNSNGSSTATQVITVNPLPVVTIAPAAPGVCAGSNVSLTASGATTYAWAPATGLSATTGATVVCTPTATTTYTITGTNAFGCIATGTVTVTYNALPTITYSPASPNYCTGGNVSITASGGVTYVWAPATGLSATTGATVTANPTVTTTYTITGTNAAGCTNTNTVTVTVNTSPTVVMSPSAPSYCTGGSTVITASGASTYAWAPATGLSATTGATVTANPTTTTTYTITGTAANGCTNSSTVTVTVNTSPTITHSPASPAYCNGGSVVITASGGNTYAWAPATGLSATTGATVTANPTTTTTYTITGTAANGCTNTNTVTVTVNPLPNITFSPSAPAVCSGNAVNITASGAATYVWSPSTGLSCTTCSTVSANPTTTTTYTVTGTSAAGCVNTATVTVTISTSPTITISPSAPSYCPGGSVALTASGGVTYAWAPATNLSATTGATVTANPTITTTYTVTGTAASGCTNTSTVTVTINTAPTISHAPATPSYCIGGSVNITASGGVTYAWAPATGLSATTGATVTANPTTTTTYTITGTAANGCTNSNTVTVTVNPLPNITFSPAAPAVCSGNAVSITASGAATYVWSPSTGLSCTTCATVSANPTTTTTYTVTGTSAAGCVNTATVTVTISTSPSVNVTPAAPSYCGGGSVVLTANGALTYAWSPATNLSATTGATVTANPTTTTTYTVTGTAASGCTAAQTVTVTVNPAPTVTHTPATPSYCGTGSVNITASGALTYVWAPATNLSSTTGATVTANPTTTTTYTITGTAANGCTSTNTVTVTVNSVPTVTKVPAAPTYCTGGNVSITASGAATYVWTPATGLSCTTCATVTASPTVTTTYTITGTSAAGCTATTTVTVTVNAVPVANAGPNVSVCPGDSVQLNATGGGTYSWAPAISLSCITCANPFAFPTSNTNYTVTVSNGPGCTATDVVNVTMNPTGTPPTISQVGNVLTCSNGVTWQWYLNSVLIPGATNQSYTITQSGTYTVCKTNNAGCVLCSTGWAAIFTGIETDLTLGSLNIFPNPNNGAFDISFDLLNKDNYTVTLTNSLGEAVYNEQLDSFSGHYSRHFDILQYGSGVYMFTLKNSSNQSVKKILVTK